MSSQKITDKTQRQLDNAKLKMRRKLGRVVYFPEIIEYAIDECFGNAQRINESIADIGGGGK